MLSERPNVRVHNDPLSMCPARESRLESGRETQGRPFLGVPLLWRQRRGTEKSFFYGAHGAPYILDAGSGSGMTALADVRKRRKDGKPPPLIRLFKNTRVQGVRSHEK